MKSNEDYDKAMTVIKETENLMQCMLCGTWMPKKNNNHHTEDYKKKFKFRSVSLHKKVA